MSDSAENLPSARLEARGLIKRFGPVTALRGVSFDLRPGEVHALCGENGAGKSTLIKTLGGVYPFGTYEGGIFVDGSPAQFRTIADATAAGIAVIHQELALVPEMSVAENIFLGSEPRRLFGLAIAADEMARRAQALLDPFGVGIRAGDRVADLGVGQRQVVEIAKALSRNGRVLILDEPTAALTEHEVEVLLGILRRLRATGLSIVYISHKLDEVMSIADRITVLRDGASVASLTTAATSKGEIIRHMVGRPIDDLFPRRSSTPGEVVLAVRGLSVASAATGKTVLSDISLEVRAGEVLGIGGLMGAGRTELLMHLFGAFGRRTGGSVTVAGRVLAAGHAPTDAIRAGLALVTEDRKRYGLLLDRPISFNLTLSSLPSVTRRGLVDEPAELGRNDQMFKHLRVKAPSLATPVGRLSGGNQQKVVIGKALLTSPRVVLLDEPTRGIDVGAKLDVYHLINELTAAGTAVVLVSSELPELLGMSDRILVLAGGRIAGAFDRAGASQENLVAAAMLQPDRAVAHGATSK